jgi:hypothetical protein
VKCEFVCIFEGRELFSKYLQLLQIELCG